ncbi:hypothetical protein ACOSQ2_015209 [Xanthoceras sorbifolium]
MIEDMFVFTAKDQPTTMEEGSDKLPSSSTSSKRARGVKGTKMEDLRSVGKGSFKSKLLSMRNPRLWTGFGALREKLSIRQEDITISEMPHGIEMILSEDLKNKLQNHDLMPLS